MCVKDTRAGIDASIEIGNGRVICVALSRWQMPTVTWPCEFIDAAEHKILPKISEWRQLR